MASLFFYRVKDKKGKTVRGARAADSREQILEELWEQDFYILNLKECLVEWKKVQSTTSGGSPLLEKKVSSRDLMVLCRQLSIMLSAGITVLHSIQILKGRTGSKLLGETLGHVAVSLEQGNTLSESFAGHPHVFPRILIYVTEAGETGGILGQVLERMAGHFEKENHLKEKIRSAAIYPLVILTVAFLVVIFLLFIVLPVFIDMFDGMEVQLPLITRMLIALGINAVKYWAVFLPAAVISLFTVVSFLKSDRGKACLDKFILKVPIYGTLCRRIMIARFTRTLGSLYASGVGLLTSLELLENIVGSTLFNQTLRRAGEAVRQGQSMTSPLKESGLFPTMVIEMISTGEESGSLGRVLQKAADFLESEIDYGIERLTALIEPVLIVFLALIVGSIVLSILLPMFEVYQYIG